MPSPAEPASVAPDGFATTTWPGSAELPRLVARQLVALRPLLQAAAVSVALLDDARRLQFVAASGIGAQAIVGQVIDHDRGIAGWVVSTGQAIGVSDISSDERFAHDVAASTGYLPQRITAIPVMGEVGPVGVMEVLDAPVDPLASASVTVAVNAMAESVADLVATVGGDGDQSASASALARLSDVDPALAQHLLAVIEALVPNREQRRR
jgi:GAF domain-containing protein